MESILLPSSEQVDQIINKKRNVLLGQVTDVVVPAEQTIFTIINSVNVEEFLFNYVLVRAEGGANLNNVAVGLYYIATGARSSIIPHVIVIDVSNGIFSFRDSVRSASDWVEVRGTDVAVNIENKKGVSFTCSVALFGVK